MKKKYLALAYEIDDNQVLEFINKLEYIKKNIVFDDVLVFSNNLTNYNKERINKTYPCIFIDLENSIKAKFINRPNRFIANVLIGDTVHEVHVKNTGRCKELLKEGCSVYLTKADNKQRKTEYDLICVFFVQWYNIVFIFQ